MPKLVQITGRVAFLLLATLSAAASAFAGGPPLQATLEIPMSGAAGAVGSASSQLDGGTARVRARIVNRDDDRTALVSLRLRYKIPPDTIAFDEIVDRIVIETRTSGGDAIGAAELDPHEVNLNPNGPRLVYQFTLYRSEEAYQARVQVFGNYE